MLITFEQAMHAIPAIQQRVAEQAEVSGVSLVGHPKGYAVRIDLRDGVVDGLPEEIEGIPVLYVHADASDRVAGSDDARAPKL